MQKNLVKNIIEQKRRVEKSANFKKFLSKVLIAVIKSFFDIFSIHREDKI